jgi:uncharacterized RDD family membrane protein YckC
VEQLQSVLDLAAKSVIFVSIMDQEPMPPAPQVIPPPDLPQSSPPPPDLPQSSPPPAQDAQAKTPGPPPLRAGAPVLSEPTTDEAASGPEAGSLAPFNTRVIAALIDMAVAIGLQISVLVILPGFAARLAWLLGVAYLVTRDSLPFLGGQSVGKKAMKLRVVTVDDKPLTGNWEAALIRNGVLLIPLFAFIELFILLTREEKPEHGLRLGDEWAKTRVIIVANPPAAAPE